MRNKYSGKLKSFIIMRIRLHITCLVNNNHRTQVKVKTNENNKFA